MDEQEFKRRRKGLKLTQSDIAELFGVTRNTIGNWESGVTELPPMAGLAIESLERRDTLALKRLTALERSGISGQDLLLKILAVVRDYEDTVFSSGARGAVVGRLLTDLHFRMKYEWSITNDSLDKVLPIAERVILERVAFWTPTYK